MAVAIPTADYDLSFEYSLSNIKSVCIESGGIRIYPNPTVGEINIENGSDVMSVSIIDLDGKILKVFSTNFSTVNASYIYIHLF